jgi:hypothetical protein
VTVFRFTFPDVTMAPTVAAHYSCVVTIFHHDDTKQLWRALVTDATVMQRGRLVRSSRLAGFGFSFREGIQWNISLQELSICPA